VSELLKHSERLGVQKLDKIADMLYWNQNKIDLSHTYATNPRYSPFHNMVAEHTDKLEFYKAVRVRLIKMWNEQIDRMKILPEPEECQNCLGWDEEIASRLGDCIGVNKWECPECNRVI